MSARPVQAEQRRTDRRTPREEMLEILVQGDPLTMFR